MRIPLDPPMQHFPVQRINAQHKQKRNRNSAARPKRASRRAVNGPGRAAFFRHKINQHMRGKDADDRI